MGRGLLMFLVGMEKTTNNQIQISLMRSGNLTSASQRQGKAFSNSFLDEASRISQTFLTKREIFLV